MIRLLFVILFFSSFCSYAQDPGYQNIGPCDMDVADFCSSPGSQFVYVATENTITLFDILNEQEIDRFEYGHQEKIRSIALSADNTYLYSVTDGGNLIKQDLIDRSIKTIPISDNGLTSVVLNRDNSRIACGTRKGEIILTGINGDSLERWKPHKDMVTDIEFSSDGTIMVSSGMDGRIIITNLSENNSSYCLSKRWKPCRDIAMNEDMSALLASCDNGKVYQWQIRPDKEFARNKKKFRTGGWVTGVSFHNDNKTWATCSSAGKVKISSSLGVDYTYKVKGVSTRIKFCYCQGSTLLVLVSVYNHGLILLSATNMNNS